MEMSQVMSKYHSTNYGKSVTFVYENARMGLRRVSHYNKRVT